MSDAKSSEPKAAEPAMTGPKPEKPAIGAAAGAGDEKKKSKTTGNKPGGDSTADKKTN